MGGSRMRGRFFAAAGLFALAGVLHECETLLPAWAHPVAFMGVTAIYLGLALCWAVSVHQRIMHRQMRRLLTACALLAALWIILRTCKYRFFDSEAVCLALWYLYYLPQLFVPVLVLLAALHLGRREEQPICRGWYLLFVPAGLLFAGIATNSLHETAFRFFPPHSRLDVYAHGPLYYLSMAYMLLMLLLSAMTLARRSRLPGGRRLIRLPGALFLSGCALSLLSFAGVITAYKLPELMSATFIVTWECCMQIGLVPTNTNYAGFFAASTLCAQITDGGDRVAFSASRPLPADGEQRRQARETGAVMLTDDTRLRCHSLSVGRVYWTESLAQINRIRERLREAGEVLSGENELVRAENEASAQQARLAEQSRLYERMLEDVRPQLARMEALLDGMTPGTPDFERRMGLVCVYGAYVKRRCNLALMREAEPLLHAQELALCIRESLGCLSDLGMAVSLRASGDALLEPGAVMLAYDFFEALAEAALPGMNALLVNLRADAQGAALRLETEVCCSLPGTWEAQRREALGAVMTLERQDGTLYASLSVKGTEACAWRD